MSDSALSARSRMVFAALGAGAMAVAAGALAVAGTSSHGDAAAYDALFGRAGQGLDAKSDVKVRGVTVGNVESVALTPEGRVRVRFRVRRDVPVPRDSEARVDPVSIFGPKEISLNLGNGPVLAEGGTLTRTKDAADPSDTAWPAYQASKAIDPQDVTTLMHTFARGLDGQGPALRRTVVNGAKVTDATHARRAEIQRLISDITGLSGTLGGRGDTIVGTARDLSDLAPLATDRPDKVTQLLDEAGRLSAQVGGTLDGHGREIGAIVDGAAPVARTVAARSGDLIVLGDALNGFFTGLASVMTADGPAGTRPAILKAPLPLDACRTVVDLCE
ncbi:MlaD family protein [Actinomadura hibisca]|uniref:MlaD family protein n=1 Tax=Actinomadura hibisca TaxID=68565 RepID=UPI000833B6D8|nr:MlaD family protein [Actinomadura hibisca]